MDSRGHVDSLPIPLQRHIPVASGELLGAVLGELQPEQQEKFSRVVRYLEQTTRLDFIDARRVLLEHFEVFSAAARGRHRFARRERELEGEELDEIELSFLSEFVELMDAAHYEILSAATWEIAQAESFTFSLPVKVEWDDIDSDMLSKFWENRGGLGAEGAADIMDRALIFTRGLDVAKAKGLFIAEKIDLLLEDLVFTPLSALKSLALGGLSRTQATAERAPEPSGNGAHVEAGKARGADSSSADTPPGRMIVERKTLRKHFPSAISLLLGMAKSVELTEPRFKEVVILYRSKSDPPSEEMEPESAAATPKAGKGSAASGAKPRNMHIKRFVDIPLGDADMVMPDKAIGVSNTTMLSLVGTMLAAVVAGIGGLFVARADGTVGAQEISAVFSVVGLLCMRAVMIYGQFESSRASVADNMNQQLYAKSLDSQEGLLLSVFEDVIGQLLKRVTLAYFCLIQQSSLIEVATLDRRVESFLQRAFGCKMDFAVELALKKLQMERLASIRGEAVDACDLDTALFNLSERQELRLKRRNESNEDLILETSSIASSFAMSTATTPRRHSGCSSLDFADSASTASKGRAGSKLMKALRGSFSMARRSGGPMANPLFDSIMESPRTSTTSLRTARLPPAWNFGTGGGGSSAMSASGYSAATSLKAASISSSDGIRGAKYGAALDTMMPPHDDPAGKNAPMTRKRRALFKRVFNSPFS